MKTGHWMAHNLLAKPYQHWSCELIVQTDRCPGVNHHNIDVPGLTHPLSIAFIFTNELGSTSPSFIHRLTDWLTFCLTDRLTSLDIFLVPSHVSSSPLLAYLPLLQQAIYMTTTLSHCLPLLLHTSLHLSSYLTNLLTFPFFLLVSLAMVCE